MELKRRTLSRVRHSRVHHFRVHHTAFTSEDGQHKQQHGAGEVLPGNASRAITHERMMKQRELCMLLERLLSLDPRSLFNRHAVCILQRNASCPLCSIFFSLFPGCQFWRASRCHSAALAMLRIPALRVVRDSHRGRVRGAGSSCRV